MRAGGLEARLNGVRSEWRTSELDGSCMESIPPFISLTICQYCLWRSGFGSGGCGVSILSFSRHK